MSTLFTANGVIDLTSALRQMAEYETTNLRLLHGPGDEVRSGGGPARRGHIAVLIESPAKEDLNPDLRFDRVHEPIKMAARDCR